MKSGINIFAFVIAIMNAKIVHRINLFCHQSTSFQKPGIVSSHINYLHDLTTDWLIIEQNKQHYSDYLIRQKNLQTEIENSINSLVQKMPNNMLLPEIYHLLNELIGSFIEYYSSVERNVDDVADILSQTNLFG